MDATVGAGAQRTAEKNSRTEIVSLPEPKLLRRDNKHKTGKPARAGAVKLIFEGAIRKLLIGNSNQRRGGGLALHFSCWELRRRARWAAAQRRSHE
jgi:hypothetical protein